MERIDDMGSLLARLRHDRTTYAILKHSPPTETMRIIYITKEQYADEIIKSIENNDVNQRPHLEGHVKP